MNTGDPSWRRQACLGALLLAGVLLGGMAQAQVVLNELMGDNRGSVPQGMEHPDWVELHNPTAAPVSLAGLSLTDDALRPRQFVFPAGTTIAAGGYLLVWCSTNAGLPGLRANFGLGSKTDSLWLLAADGVTVLDQIHYGLQAPDLSIGRIPNGTGPWKLNEPTPLGANELQALAPPDFLRLNEWLAMPGMGNDDWIELYNAAPLPVELSGLVMTDRPSGTPTNRPIPALSFMAAHGFAQFFASDLDNPGAHHLDFKLSSSGEVLSLYQPNRATLIDRIIYGQQTSLTSQGRAPDGGPNIVSFQPARVTPGAPNFAMMTSVVISEILSHSDPPQEDAIELHNNSDQPVDIGYWWLSDAASDLKKHQIPAGTILPARGFRVFYAYQFGAGPKGFTLNSYDGDEVYVSAGDAAGNLNGQQAYVKFGPLKNGVSAGRHQTSLGWEFVPLVRPTFGVDQPISLQHFRTGTGATNAGPRVGPVVINELYYRSPVGAALEVEFIELHNPTGQEVALYDPLYPANRWRIRKGVSYVFPSHTTIPAGGFLLLVDFDPGAHPTLAAAFRQAFNVPAAVPVLGPYEGKLSDAGEELELQWPDKPEPPDSGKPGFVPYEQVERIVYGAGGSWPVITDQAPHSLQRRAALDFGNEPLNWLAAPPTAGRRNLADRDGDGLPDDWELAYGLDPGHAADASLDADGDGASNWEEFVMGTDPRRADSVFQAALQVLPGREAVLQFEAQPGRAYQIEWLPALGGAWRAWTNIPAAAEAGMRQIPLLLGGSQGFFRLSGATTP